MQLTVYLADGGELDIADFDAETALDLRQALEDNHPWLTFDMDGATVLVQKSHVVRVDMETGD